MSAGDDRRWKVGELAKATGLTVRALHHYDEVALLVPSERTSAGMGDPFDPHDRGLSVPPLTHLVLERAHLEASELEDEEVAGEHVLLALTDDWPGSLSELLPDGGIDATVVRNRLVSASDGMLPAPEPPPPELPPPISPQRMARPPEPELAPSPLGHDPRRRKPWGSGVSAPVRARRSSRGSRCASTGSIATGIRSSAPTAGRCTH